MSMVPTHPTRRTVSVTQPVTAVDVVADELWRLAELHDRYTWAEAIVTALLEAKLLTSKATP